MHLQEEKFIERVQKIYDVLSEGRLQDALRMGKNLLSIQDVPVEDLHKQLTGLLELYVDSLGKEPSEEAIDRLHMEPLDAKLVALMVDKLTRRVYDTDNKAEKKRRKNKYKVIVLFIHISRRRKRNVTVLKKKFNSCNRSVET